MHFSNMNAVDWDLDEDKTVDGFGGEWVRSTGKINAASSDLLD